MDDDGNVTERPESPLYELSTVEIAIWCFLYATIAFLAVAGNILVIIVTLTRLRTRSITTYFIINLAFADLLTAIFAIPFKFQAALFQVWHLPSILCQIVPYTETVTLSVSVFTLTASAIHEFRTVFFPKRVRMNPNSAKIMVISIWVVALILSLPHGLFHAVEIEEFTNIPRCMPMYFMEPWWKTYNIYLFVVNYFVPMIILDTAYTMIAVRIYISSPSAKNRRITVMFQTAHDRIAAIIYTSTSVLDERRSLNTTPPPSAVSNKQLMKMLMIVVLVFTLCWAPLESYLALNEVFDSINEWYYINLFFFGAHWLAMSNSCLNPIIYGVFNAKYKREFARIFRCVRYGRFESDVTIKFDTELESHVDHNRNGNLKICPDRSWTSAGNSPMDELATPVPFYSETNTQVNYKSINGHAVITPTISCRPEML